MGSWQRSTVIAAAALGVFLAAAPRARAHDEFEDAFKYELGRIVAHEVAALGHAIVGELIYPHYHGDNVCYDGHSDHGASYVFTEIYHYAPRLAHNHYRYRHAHRTHGHVREHAHVFSGHHDHNNGHYSHVRAHDHHRRHPRRVTSHHYPFRKIASSRDYRARHVQGRVHDERRRGRSTEPERHRDRDKQAKPDRHRDEHAKHGRDRATQRTRRVLKNGRESNRPGRNDRGPHDRVRDRRKERDSKVSDKRVRRDNTRQIARARADKRVAAKTTRQRRRTDTRVNRQRDRRSR